jgi:hypothetical protein
MGGPGTTPCTRSTWASARRFDAPGAQPCVLGRFPKLISSWLRRSGGTWPEALGDCFRRTGITCIRPHLG